MSCILTQDEVPHGGADSTRSNKRQAAQRTNLSAALHVQYAAMLTGWSLGEKDLLRHSMARFGDRVDLIRKFLLPTKTVDSIRSYIKVCCRPKSVLPGDSEQGTQRCEHAQDCLEAPAWTFPATSIEPMC